MREWEARVSPTSNESNHGYCCRSGVLGEVDWHVESGYERTRSRQPNCIRGLSVGNIIFGLEQGCLMLHIRWFTVTGIPATNYHMYYHMYYHLIAGTVATNYNRQATLYRVTTEGSKIIHQARE
jgi:hypothetical protein